MDSMARASLKRSISNPSLALAAQNLKRPLHARVRQILRDRILSDFQHGERFHSERELIQKLGVSQPTIRRALTDLVAEGYLLPDPRRGFFVQHHAEQRYVGLITPVGEVRRHASEDPQFSAVCRSLGYSLIAHELHKGDDAQTLLRSIVHKPSEERLILTGLTVDLTIELSLELKARGYRHLVIGPRISGFSGSSLSLDHESEADQVLDHLLELGHEQVVFMVNEPKDLLFTSLRAKTLQRRLDERKLANYRLIFCETRNWDNSFEAAYRKAKELLNTKNPPTAIVPLSGVGAWAVMRYAIENRIDVPGKLSIVSFDPMVNSEILPIPMTEMTFSHWERTRTAIEALWGDSPDPVHIKVTTKLTPRKSSGPAS